MGIEAPRARQPGDLVDQRAMRRAIFEGQRDSPLIRAVMRQADIEGLNEADRYVMLSYHALIALERHFQRALEITALYPNPPNIGRGG